MGTCEALLGGCPRPPAQQVRNSRDESGWHRVLPPLSLTVAAEWTCCCRPAEHSLYMSCGSGHALANRLVLGSLSIAHVHITPCLLTHWMATQTTNPVSQHAPPAVPIPPTTQSMVCILKYFLSVILVVPFPCQFECWVFNEVSYLMKIVPWPSICSLVFFSSLLFCLGSSLFNSIQYYKHGHPSLQHPTILEHHLLWFLFKLTSGKRWLTAVREALLWLPQARFSISFSLSDSWGRRSGTGRVCSRLEQKKQNTIFFRQEVLSDRWSSEYFYRRLKFNHYHKYLFYFLKVLLVTGT